MRQKRTCFFLVWGCVSAALLLGSLIAPGKEREESIQELMRDAVLHESHQISLFGLREVNPGLVSALAVTIVLLTAALFIRIFWIPKFREVPGRLQLILEEAVSIFDKLAKTNSPWRNTFLGAYLFAAGTYIFLEPCSSCWGSRLQQPMAHPSTFPHRFQI